MMAPVILSIAKHLGGGMVRKRKIIEKLKIEN
jgi:hypothetical protein